MPRRRRHPPRALGVDPSPPGWLDGRSAFLGMGLMETTTTVMKRAELQEVGAPTRERGFSPERRRRWSGDEPEGAGAIMQVWTPELEPGSGGPPDHGGLGGRYRVFQKTLHSLEARALGE